MSDLHTADLFAPASGEPRTIAPGAVQLPGAALGDAPALLAAIRSVLAGAPWRQMLTPGGFRMSVAMSNCGALGWVSDRRGYRYSPIDPDSGQPWPAMPAALQALATDSAARAGFAGFVPDACLINRYAPGAKMALHQDRDEADFSQPIVSLSLGLPAVFLFGGFERSDKPARLPLTHGDVLVWGGPARLRFHGVLPVKDGSHPATGACRLNLTFRKAG
ncbi:MAG: DNA oxidative demethylase AlkB [Zoogloea sp.]|uniref:DNA oxidative demethylase AlkB n=1 Tax=Zoogloea sp. TaxID=49181 RepID=UPI00260F7399|nr:DNA oxidative demethylase AlkB [Zoogloea sp.]MDD3329404.1 DNA oxidative demethylase AlkB [Zoogloea sp.]